MTEKSPEINSRELESKPTHERLKELSNKLGFVATQELKDYEKLAVSPLVINEPEKFAKLLTKFQEIGETITHQMKHDEGDKSFALARVGLMVRRAAILSETFLPIELEAEMYDVLTELDNLASSNYLDDKSIIHEVENLYETIRTTAIEESESLKPTTDD